ncbi:MAG: KamA family radical SAM protein [Nanoarchaeota archaeon]|nr:KamA family radical SAM protein [Nanoarchaeota archaeon]
MPEWEELLKESITNSERLARNCNVVEKQEIREVIRRYPLCINKYYFNLIKEKNDPIWNQCIPHINEITDKHGLVDPLHEEEDSPVPGLTHRYPDRVLLLVSNRCAMYCRFCTRKRRVGDPFKAIFKEQTMKGIDYIREHKEVRDVVLSGGDPLLLKDERIEFILKELRKIEHVEIIRIGTKVPCTLPQRITPELCQIISKYHPVFVNVHFNHPRELTEESKNALKMLVDAGIPVGNQTVLLRDVNDNKEVMKELTYGLMKTGVYPYYIYQADLTKGTDHFRTKVKDSLEIINNLRMFEADLPTPYYIIDAPGGGGKIPLIPDYEKTNENQEIVKIKSDEDIQKLKNKDVQVIILKSDIDDLTKIAEVRALNKEAILVINSKIISENPEKITQEACVELKKNTPLFINTCFNRADQINETTEKAIAMMKDNGLVLCNNTTVYKGENDNPIVIRELMHKLLKLRIKPSYIAFDSNGNSVKTKTRNCMKLIKSLRGFTSGLAVPHFAIENNGEKVIVGPNYVIDQDSDKIILQNYAGKIYEYPEPILDESCNGNLDLINTSASKETEIAEKQQATAKIGGS